jgi:hypothetical protein
LSRHVVNEEQLSPEKGREMLKAKGIVQNIGNEDLLDRIVLGFLYKKGKYSQITQYRLRWFFMASEWNLRDPTDLRCVTFSELPEWVQLDTMYYFNPEDESQHKGSVRVKDVTEIAMQVNEKPYRMVVKVEQESDGR